MDLWTWLNQLLIYDGLVLLNRKRNVIPVGSRDDTQKELHIVHQSIERSKRRAREIVY